MTDYQFMDDCEISLIVYQHIKFHMVFDVNIYIMRRDRLVAGENMTETPASLTYSSAVSRNSFRISLILAVFYYLNFLECDIVSSYLNDHFW